MKTKFKSYCEEKYDSFKFLATICIGILVSLSFFSSRDINEIETYFKNKQHTQALLDMKTQLLILNERTEAFLENYDELNEGVFNLYDEQRKSFENLYFDYLLIDIMKRKLFFLNDELGVLKIYVGKQYLENYDKYKGTVFNNLTDFTTNNLPDNKEYWLETTKVDANVFCHHILNSNPIEETKINQIEELLNNVNKSMFFNFFIKSYSHIIYLILALLIVVSLLFIFLGSSSTSNNSYVSKLPSNKYKKRKKNYMKSNI